MPVRFAASLYKSLLIRSLKVPASFVLAANGVRRRVMTSCRYCGLVPEIHRSANGTLQIYADNLDTAFVIVTPVRIHTIASSGPWITAIVPLFMASESPLPKWTLGTSKRDAGRLSPPRVPGHSTNPVSCT